MNEEDKQKLMNQVFQMLQNQQSPDNKPKENLTLETKEKRSRKKREYTPEEMDALKERLRSARATSALNRKSKKELKDDLITQVKTTVNKMPVDKIQNPQPVQQQYSQPPQQQYSQPPQHQYYQPVPQFDSDGLTKSLLSQVEKLMDTKMSKYEQQRQQQQMDHQEQKKQQEEKKELPPHKMGQKRLWKQTDEFNL